MRRRSLIASATLAPFSTRLLAAPDAMFNVKAFGAVGDGLADDTSAIQAAIHAASLAVPATVFFPEGTYALQSVYYYPGLTFRGESAILKKLASADRWSRMFTRPRASEDEDDTAWVVWRDLIFDGNSAAHPSYRKYELEHAHILFLVASPRQRGRLRAVVEDCLFHNCVADAISVYTNVEAVVTRCVAHDCFRGGLVITGGNTRVRASELEFSGGADLTRLDIEIDGAGYDGSLEIDVEVADSTFEHGFDVGANGGRVELRGITSKTGPSYFACSNTDVVVRNSTIAFGRADTYGNRFVKPGHLKFFDCEFIFHREPSIPGPQTIGILIYWGTQGRVEFTDCRFSLDRSIGPADSTFVVNSLANSLSRDNRLAFLRCRMESLFDDGIIAHGGWTHVHDTFINARRMIVQEGAPESSWELLLDGAAAGPHVETWLDLHSTSGPGRLIHYNILVAAGHAAVTVDTRPGSVEYKGTRAIRGNGPAAGALAGLPGDSYTDENGSTWSFDGLAGSTDGWRRR
jgi:hypothetical protein